MTPDARSICSYILLAAALGAALLNFPRASRAEVANPPAQARAMTAADLHALFGGKSWQWQDGAGRLEIKDRQFIAFSGTGEQSSWAEGRWSVSDAGRLCLIADWHTTSGTYPARTCFVHKLDGDTIYQRKEPSGEWYVFKHAKPEAGDEFNKLVRDDLVFAEFAKRKTNTPSKKKP
ncbi:DUF995 domain-containing protein [Aestuariivirga sp.]|uniref:DUF995 domain-containing protein n=1 Tax=Aestuariivirga sp. TaxID=2650926 RepID=UPI003BAAD062